MYHSTPKLHGGSPRSLRLTVCELEQLTECVKCSKGNNSHQKSLNLFGQNIEEVDHVTTNIFLIILDQLYLTVFEIPR